MTSASVVSTFLAASSSRHTDSMDTLLPLTSTDPSIATRAVLWNPEVLEPSTTIFLMKWISSTVLAPIISANVRVTSSASGSAPWGGSSSSSTRQDTPGTDWYLYPRFLLN